MGVLTSAFKTGRKLWYSIKQPVGTTTASAATKERFMQSSAGQALLASMGAKSAVPAITTASIPAAVTAAAAVPAIAKTAAAVLPWWRGPGGKLQMPWSDPQQVAGAPGMVLDDSYLRVYYRAPRGYVVVRDPNGKPYAMLKQYARMLGMWRPTAKPPISATDWKHFKRNRAIEKKLKKIVPANLRTIKRVEPKTSKKR